MKPHIQEKSESFVIRYPEAEDFMNEQLKIFWTADEVNVEKDIHSILTDFTESEKHGVITTLKLFTLYELRAGSDYWCGRFMRMFKRPEIQAMGSVFGAFELGVHKPFYNKINELLHINTDEFYESYVTDPLLKSRMDFIDSIVSSKNDLVSLAGFSLVEGCILYSSFAFLKHFQSNGKNKLTNMVRGLNFSVRDEQLHSLAGAWAFKTLKSQLKLKSSHEEALREDVIEMAENIFVHESRIIDMIFEKGDIENCNKDDLKIFVKSRINVCLTQLGYAELYVIESNNIADYFYKGIKNYAFNDFFTGMSAEYSRNWDETAFKFKGKYKNDN
jgi:ribonucleotide reductase beta subunit family protein with ferritin-like domain